MRQLVKSIIRDRRLTLMLSAKLAGRQLQLQYRRNALGFVWLVLAPLAYAFIFVVIKSGMNSNGLRIETGALHPGLFAFVGIAFYQIFLDGLLKQMEALRSHRNFVANNVFPPEAIFIAEALSLAPTALTRVAIICVFASILDAVPSLSTVGALIGVGLAAMAVSHAFGILIAPFAVLYADFGTAVRSFSLGFLLVSPVFYPATRDSGTVLYAINLINPLAPIIQVARASLTGEGSFLMVSFVAWCAVAALLLVIGLLLHRRILPILAERIV